MAAALVGVPTAATPAADAASAGWYDGLIKYSTITNCASIIWGNPYQENGAGTYVGFYADPDNSQPAPNQTYYLHIVVYGLGNACSGMRVVPEIALPSNTSLAITAGTPVYCFATGVLDQADCPQTLPPSGFNPGAYQILSPDAANANTWPLPQGKNWEFQIPVRSTSALTAAQFHANVWVLDGNSSPWLTPTQGAFVFQPGVPSISYPSPSTTDITRTFAKSWANIYSGGLAGKAHFQLGTTTAYGLADDVIDIPAGGPNWQLWDDWQPTPSTTLLAQNTTYHFRVWFQPTGSGTIYYGADQAFRTVGTATTFTVGGLSGGLTGGTRQSVTVTAKDALGGTAAGYRGTVVFSSTDANAGLPANYTFTAADSGTHTFSLGVTLMNAGTWEVRARDKAKSDITGAQTGISVTSTATAATAAITRLPAWKASTSVAVAWSATPGTYPLANYDVRYKRAAWNGTFGLYAMWRSASTATSGTFAGAAGNTYCFSARARDSHGGLSTWTADTCTAVPLDDRSLTRGGTWGAGTGTPYYLETYVNSTTLNASLTRTSVQAKRFAIMATTCPTCGSVKVYWAGSLLKTISLVSTTTVNKKLITVTTFSTVKTGTLKLVVSTSGKQVRIDGVAISRT